MSNRSLVDRLTLNLTVVAGLLFAGVGAAIFLFQGIELQRHQTSELKARLDIILPLVEQASQTDRWIYLKEKLTSFIPPDDSLLFVLKSSNPRLDFGTDLLEGAQINHYSDGSFYIHRGTRVFHAVDAQLPPGDRQPAMQVIVAVDCLPVQNVISALGLWVAVVSLSAIAIIALLGRVIAKQGLKPLEALSRHASGLDPNDSLALLPEMGLPDELQDMTKAFNGALERLHAANNKLAGFNADVAHELRTPLSNLIGQTQVALSRRRSPDELEDLLHSNLEEFERMRQIVNDMLFLARADQGAMANNLATASMRSITRTTADIFEAMLEDAGMTLAVSGDATARVEASLLGRAVANLIDNAIRYSAKSGCVEINIKGDDENVLIAVSNPAEPQVAMHFDRIFNRFYRADPARHRNGASGHGLGLAITKAIVTMHGGTVSARYTDGLATIELTLPRDGPYEAARTTEKALIKV